MLVTPHRLLNLQSIFQCSAGAADFDGTNDWLKLASDFASNADGTQGICSFWVNFSSASSVRRVFYSNNGGTVGSYQTNVSNIIARYKASCARVGVSNPTFILVSIYPTSDDTTRSVNIATALRTIAENDTSVEMVDLRAYVTNQFGAYTSWQATYAPDGIHPNVTFSNILADYIWSRL